MLEKAVRYDVKGKKYIDTPAKYYIEDVGLRNAHLNFRQQEENHIMEIIIYTELRSRGYRVDVGVVESFETSTEGKTVRKQLNTALPTYGVVSFKKMLHTSKKMGFSYSVGIIH